MKVFALLSDAFGGYGGIAKYNRDLLTALSSAPEVDQVVVVPRVAPLPIGELPPKIHYVTRGLNSKRAYALAVAQILASEPRCGLVLCGHINLLPLAYVAARRYSAPIVLCIHGIEAWRQHESFLVRKLASRVDWVFSVSQLTVDRFRQWTDVEPEKCAIIPNAVDLDSFKPGPKRPDLLARYGLQGKRVLMTAGRLASEERYKGFDDILDLLPALLRRHDDLAYVVIGEGDDRTRLVEKARALGIAGSVVFTGMVEEREKADHYRLADVFVMPSRGEGFGIVFLEAMASGIPVIASRLDGGREALRDGLLGRLVDSEDPAHIEEAVLAALAAPMREVPEGLEYFSFAQFQQRVRARLPMMLTPRRRWTPATVATEREL